MLSDLRNSNLLSLGSLTCAVAGCSFAKTGAVLSSSPILLSMTVDSSFSLITHQASDSPRIFCCSLLIASFISPLAS
ncbi:hypothetical protein PF008_g31721 [Phytophthora fragariae]|uniref:Uncharacterized protein n=1 Tax=Phytophthora fragariae TaxID=53985 RepID=A0A6G0Q2C9_9STRA|nr:hypothetical protein PF008_g31721 [Phytophthora fragariae]